MQGVRVCIMWGCPNRHHVYTKVTDTIHRYIKSHLGWHFRMLFQCSKLKARTSLFTETCQKRRSSFELWAFENVTLSGIGCTYYVLWYLQRYIMDTYTYIHIYTYAYIHMCMRIHIYIHIYIYIYIHIWKYINTHLALASVATSLGHHTNIYISYMIYIYIYIDA